METDATIERIKGLEDWGKKMGEEAEAKKAGILQKAREKSLILIEEFERTRETDLELQMAKAEEKTQKEAEKILSKAQKEAADIRKRTSERTPEVSKKLFDRFRKKLLL